MSEEDSKRHITPQQAQEFLQKKGLKISEKNADLLLDFLYKIANLYLNQIRRKKDEKC